MMREAFMRYVCRNQLRVEVESPPAPENRS